MQVFQKAAASGYAEDQSATLFGTFRSPGARLQSNRCKENHASQAQGPHKTYKDRGRHFSDGEANPFGPVNVLVWQDNSANLIGVDTGT